MNHIINARFSYDKLINPCHFCNECDNVIEKEHIISNKKSEGFIKFFHIQCFFETYKDETVDYICRACNKFIKEQESTVNAHIILPKSHQNEIIHAECCKQLATNKKQSNNFFRIIKKELRQDQKETKLNQRLNSILTDLKDLYKEYWNDIYYPSTSYDDGSDDDFPEMFFNICIHNYESLLLSYAKKKEVEKYKKELIEKTWHPSRYDYWKHYSDD